MSNKNCALFVTGALLLLPAAAACPICQGELPDPARFADAIYRIEGGQKARVPFGILSVPVRSFEHARSLCEATVARQWVRWAAAGRRECYLVSLANRYCPPSHDPVGHRNWLHNICNALAMQVSAARRPVGPKPQQTRDFAVGTPPAQGGVCMGEQRQPMVREGRGAGSSFKGTAGDR